MTPEPPPLDPDTTATVADFDLRDFLPYLLAQAAETSSLAFQRRYRETYGMLRTEWRVVFHLGRYGPMTATQVCGLARVHKTKVSRAVAALEAKRYLTRSQDTRDRRQEVLVLTRQGAAVFADLYAAARQFDAQMVAGLSPSEVASLKRNLARIAGL